MNNITEVINLYKTCGLPLVRTKNKAPVVLNWQKLADNNTLWGGNLLTAIEVGFVITSDIVVIDVDPRNFSQGEDSLKKLSETINYNIEQNASFSVRTASGGLHLYYKKDSSKKFPNTLSDFKGVEFKQKGQQVIIPGSHLPDGRKYTLIKGSLYNLIEVPASLYELCNANQDTHRAKTTGTGFSNSPADINRLKKLLDKTPPAISGQNGDNSTFRVCCLGKDFGVSPEMFFPLLCEWNERCSPPWSHEDLKQKMLNAYGYGFNTVGSHSIENIFNSIEKNFEKQPLTKEQADAQTEELSNWEDELQKNKNGAIKNTLKNAVLYIKNDPELKNKLAFNEFSGDKVWLKHASWHHQDADRDYTPNGRMWTDTDAIETRYLLNNYNFDVGTNLIYEAVTKVCNTQSYHPVRSWIQNQKEWDGENRLDTFFHKYCGADDNIYSKEVARKMFCAIVARVFEPGCKFDFLPILVGKQGMNKSTFLKILSIHPSWFCDNIGDITNVKELVPQTRGKLVVEWQELALFNKIDINHSKSFLSTSVDRVREAYHREAKDYPRQFIVVATTNQDKFLLDETGNRRMFPVAVKEINIAAVANILPQLYAEALQLYKKGEKLYITNEKALEIAEQIRYDRFKNDELEDTILQWLENIPEDCRSFMSRDKLQVNDILIHCLKETPTKARGISNRIGNILRRQGYSHQTYWQDGKAKKGFVKK
jgi:predicted P-loop ATPase